MDIKKSYTDNETRLYVGGLKYELKENELKKLFEEGDESTGSEGCGEGTVKEAQIITDRETRRSRGFGFVTMTDKDNAKEAIKLFHESEFQGRMLKVDLADQQGGARRNDTFRQSNGGNRSFRSGSPHGSSQPRWKNPRDRDY